MRRARSRHPPRGCPRASFSSTPFEQRDPFGNEVRVVAGAEEPLGALEEIVVVLVPADAGAALERLADLRFVTDERA